MKKYKIVFLCHFSNPSIRGNLCLKDYYITNRLLKFFKKRLIKYNDFAVWVTDYIFEFEKHPEFGFYIVAPHKGMKRNTQQFNINGVSYNFFKCDNNFLIDYFRLQLKIEEKNDYIKNRSSISSIISSISPDLIILCGAENPSYSASVLDFHDIPIYVIPQSLLNDEKRIEMGVGTPYRRKIELEIFQHAHYFCTSEEKIVSRIIKENDGAIFLPAGFPTHRPVVSIPEKKVYDFVFFARKVSKNKGVEDLLHAFTIVKRTYKNSSVNIIGSCVADYKNNLDKLINDLGIQNNVHFSGYFEQISETYKCVVKAKTVVVPGITAALNSTVRESMLMGLPTICYETTATTDINKDSQCLLTAKMEDVEDLAKQMIYVLDYPEQADTIAKNGKEYADRVFSNEAIVNKLIDNCQKIIEKEV